MQTAESKSHRIALIISYTQVALCLYTYLCFY